MDIDPTPENAASLDTLLDLAKRTLDTQNSQTSALDGKAGFVFGSASLLTAGIAAFQKSAFDAVDIIAGNTGGLVWWVQLVSTLLILVAVASALALYLRVVGAAYQAYKLVDFDSISVKWEVRDRYLSQQQIETKTLCLDEMVRAAEANRKVIARKRVYTEIAVNSLMFEAKLVAGVIAAQAIFLAITQIYGR